VYGPFGLRRPAWAARCQPLIRLGAALCLGSLGVALSVVEVDAAAPRITFDRDSIRAGESLLVTAAGFDPNTAVTYSISSLPDQEVSAPWANSGFTYPRLATDRTDANGAASGTLTFSKDYPPGPQTVCITEASGTGACEQFVMLAAVPSGSNTVPLIVAMLVFVGLALAVVRMRSSWLPCLPGIASRSRVGARLSLAGYGLLSFSFLFMPFAVFATIATLFAAFRRSFRSSIKLISPGNPAKIVVGWFLWILGFITLWLISVTFLAVALTDQTDPTATLAERLLQLAMVNAGLLTLFAVIGLGRAVWTTAGVEPRHEPVGLATNQPDPELAKRALRDRLVDFFMLSLATPFAITRLKMPEKRPPVRAAWWLFVIASWVVIFALLAAGATYELFAAHDAGAGDLPWFVARYLICAVVVMLGVWVVRRSYLASIGTQPVHDPAGSPPSTLLQRLRSMNQSGWMRFGGEGLALILLWAAVAGLAALPWVAIERLGPAYGTHTNPGGAAPGWLQGFASSAPTALVVGRLTATALAATPLIAISLAAIYLSLPIGPSAGVRVEFREAVRRVFKCALLVAVAFVFAGSLVEYSSFLVERGIGEPIAVLLAGICVGLATGLAMGMAREFQVGKRWTEAAAGLAALGYCVILVYILLIIALQEWNAHSSRPSWNWIAVASGGVAGLYVGFILGDVVLIPGLKAFSAIGRYLKELLWPLVGFAAGYICILLLFAAIYYAVHATACVRGSDVNFTSATSPLTPLSCALGFRDFVYFSFNTIAPLGYSDIRPVSDSMKYASAFELGAGIAWTLVIFGGVIAHLNDKHVRKIVMDSLMQTLRRGSIFGVGAPATSLEELGKQLQRPALSLSEQFALVSGLKRAFWQQPERREPVNGLMHQMLGRLDLYHLPGQELEAAVSLADDLQRKGPSPSTRVSQSLLLIAVVALLIMAGTAVAAGATSSSPGQQAVGDPCVVGRWILQEQHIYSTTGLDVAGGKGARLTLRGDGTATYDYGAADLFSGMTNTSTPALLQISGVVTSRVRASSSGSWSEVPQSLQRFAFTATDGKSLPAWPTVAQSYQCSPTALSLASQAMSAVYSRN
jgi:hypothetical protein